MRVRWTDNLELVELLHHICFPVDDFDETPDRGNKYWLAETLDGLPAGFASARLTDDGQSMFLSRAGVVPFARGKGLQTRLIKARLQWGRKQGAAEALTYTATDNPASMRSLIRCDFLPYLPAWYWGGRQSIYFSRTLTS